MRGRSRPCYYNFEPKPGIVLSRNSRWTWPVTKVSVHCSTPARLSCPVVYVPVYATCTQSIAQYCCSSACPLVPRRVPEYLLSFLALLVPCARSLDLLLHPSLSMQVDRLGCHAVQQGQRERGREREEVASWILPRGSTATLPQGSYSFPGTAPWSHSTESGCYYEAGGLREAGFWTDPSPLPHGRRSPHTHGHDQPASLQACGWDPRRGQDNGVVGRREPTCLKPEFQRCPQNCSPNRLCCRFVGLLPVSTPRKIHCGMHSMYLSSQASEHTRAAPAPPACVRP